MTSTVKRPRPVDVPRCEAMTQPKWYSPEGHQCPYAAMVNLDGQWLCKLHADKWVRAEGDFAKSENTP